MSTRPYVEHVYSNLKSPRPNGDAWGIDIGPKTLIVGSNTSHKSTIVQAVELAIAGSADDIIGRSIVSDAALLLTLAPGDELGVTARLSDGSTANYNARREDGKVKRPQHDGPGAQSLVHRSVAAALSGSATTARKAFLEWSSSGVKRDDILACLPSALHGKYGDIAQHRGRDLSETKTLIEVLNYANSRSREISKEIKGAQLVLENIGDSIDAKPTDETMEKMRFAVAEAREILDASIRAASTGMTEEEKQSELERLAQQLNAWEQNTLTCEQQKKDLLAQLPSKGDNVDLAIEIVTVATEHSLDQCPVCSSHVGLEHLQKCRSFYEQQVESWEKQSEPIIQKLVEADKAIDSSNQNMAAVQAEINRVHGLPTRSKDSRAIPVNDAQSRLEVAMETLTKMELVCERWNDLTNARKSIESLTNDQESYRALRIACEEAVGSLLSEQTRNFTELVQTYLPDTWKFKIELMDGEREVFRMGFERDGRLHCALSGAEWATVITAVSMAVSTKLDSNAPAVLVPYDRAWDARTLSAVMKGFLNFEGQVIIASTVRPMGRPPKGWTILDMDVISKEWAHGPDEPEEESEPVEETFNHKPIRKKVRNDRGLSVISRSAKKLEERGFLMADILTMTKETAAHLIENNVEPHTVTITADGGFKVKKVDNILPINLPPAP
tara:strand:+ start:12735 stop:14747 length:2013 start_codon:yes stop_codon:yes gene_type:complete